MKFNAIIRDRTLKFINLETLKNFLQEFDDGQRLTVTIEKEKKIRSLKANAFYWGFVLPTISDETGEDQLTLHGIFKRDYLPRKYTNLAGKKRLVESTTTNLSNKEFSIFVEKVMAFGSTYLGIEWNFIN